MTSPPCLPSSPSLSSMTPVYLGQYSTVYLRDIFSHPSHSAVLAHFKGSQGEWKHWSEFDFLTTQSGEFWFLTTQSGIYGSNLAKLQQFLAKSSQTLQKLVKLTNSMKYGIFFYLYAIWCHPCIRQLANITKCTPVVLQFCQKIEVPEQVSRICLTLCFLRPMAN